MNLIYQAYGRADIIRQSLFSVISLLHVTATTSPLNIWIYTDQVDELNSFFKDSAQAQKRVRIINLSPQQLKEFRGAIDFVHRVKIEVLIDAGKKCAGALFYVDGDTIFLKDVTSLFSQVTDEVSLMHIAECELVAGKDPLSKKLVKFVKKHKFVIDGEAVQLDPTTVMWNAGAIGISEKNKNLLPLILNLTDKMHSEYPKHVMEQLAVSYYLQTRTHILPADKEIFHYWNQKDEYQKLIDDYFLKYKSCAEALEHFAEVTLLPVSNEDSRAKKRPNFFQKILGWN